MADRFWYTCPKCGSSRESKGLCYACGNNNLPDWSFENRPNFHVTHNAILNPYVNQWELPSGEVEDRLAIHDRERIVEELRG